MSDYTNNDSITKELDSINESTVAKEIIPSMRDFEDEINRSFKRIDYGTILTGTVIGIKDTEVIVDLGSYSEGIIPIQELSHDPRFSIKSDIIIGESISAVVLREDREGNIILSKKEADSMLSYDLLKEYMAQQTVKQVKVQEVVNAGVVTYIEGIRAFIPASQLSLTYTNDLSEFLGRVLDVVVITVEEDKNKVILSAKEVEKKLANEDKSKRISRLQVGIVTTGIVETLVPYGAFINLSEGLSGLVHISQICGKRIKTPSEILKEGMEVTVKIIDIKDGKISLSMKEVEESEEVAKEGDDVPFEFSSDGSISTGLGALLANIKL